MYLALGVDVNTAGRFVQDQEPRHRRKPFCDDNLLLVSTGEAGDYLFPVRQLDVERFDVLVGDLPLLGPIDDAEPVGKYLVDTHRQVVTDGHVEYEGLDFSVFGKVGDPVGYRLLGASDLDRFSVEEDLSFRLLSGADDEPGRFCPTRTDKPGKPHDLTLVDGEAHILDIRRTGEVLCLEDDLVGGL